VLEDFRLEFHPWAEMKPKTLESLLAALVIFAALGYVWSSIYTYFPNNPAPRAEMRHFIARVPLNTTKNQFDKRFTDGKYQYLELKQNSNYCSVHTPIEFGAKNWLLYAEFDGDNLAALRMRTPDDMRFRPRDNAPADKVASSWKKPFPDFK